MKSNIHDFSGFSSLKTVFSENYFYSASNSGRMEPLAMLKNQEKWKKSSGGIFLSCRSRENLILFPPHQAFQRKDSPLRSVTGISFPSGNRTSVVPPVREKILKEVTLPCFMTALTS